MVENECFINAPSPMIVPGNKYLLAILNSKLADWYIRGLGVTRNGGYFEYKPMFVEKFPIPQIQISDEQQFIEFVEIILKKKKNNVDCTKVEKNIDRLVYKLYGLLEKEIEKIESY